MAALHAADVFNLASFESGWKQVSRVAVQGVASDGKRVVVAWGQRGYLTSADGGLTWSQPILASTGPVGAAGSIPVEIADCIVTSDGRIYLRTIAGAVMRINGGPHLAPIQGIDGMGVQMITVDGVGGLYCEGGGVVIVVDQAGRRLGQQAGRLLGVVREAAVVVDGAGVVWRLDGAGASRRLALAGGVDARNLRAAVRQSAPPTGATFVDTAGGTWRLDGDTLTSGGVPAGLEVRFFGGFNGKVAGVRLTGLGVAVDAGQVVLVGMDDGGRLRRVPDVVTAGVDAVAPVSVPDGARWRLVGVGAQAGIQTFRSGL